MKYFKFAPSSEPTVDYTSLSTVGSDDGLTLERRLSLLLFGSQGKGQTTGLHIDIL